MISRLLGSRAIHCVTSRANKRTYLQILNVFLDLRETPRKYIEIYARRYWVRSWISRIPSLFGISFCRTKSQEARHRAKNNEPNSNSNPWNFRNSWQLDTFESRNTGILRRSRSPRKILGSEIRLDVSGLTITDNPKRNENWQDQKLRSAYPKPSSCLLIIGFPICETTQTVQRVDFESLGD